MYLFVEYWAIISMTSWLNQLMSFARVKLRWPKLKVLLKITFLPSYSFSQTASDCVAIRSELPEIKATGILTLSRGTSGGFSYP